MISDEQLKAMRQEPTWVQDPATQPQVNYIKRLVEDRAVPEEILLKIKGYVEAEGGLKKGKAGEIINVLKQLPIMRAHGEDRSKNRPTVLDIPAGRYAVQTGDEEEDLSFYRVKDVRGGPDKEGGYRFIAQIAGPNEHPLKRDAAREAAKAIVRAGIGDSAVLYGRKVGRCSQCHTRITNRVSRELGIGPVCGGRVYDDWEERVNTARTAIILRGQDPNENVDE
jgi:hypothetical protein